MCFTPICGQTAGAGPRRAERGAEVIWVALLRAANVSGVNRLPIEMTARNGRTMAALAQELEAAT
jgi:hypothetical protein